MTLKKILIPTICALVLAVSCGKQPAASDNKTNPVSGNPTPEDNAPAPLETLAKPLPAPKPSVPSTTSFAAVTKHLDAGGDFYLYWNANQLQNFAQDGLEKLEEVLKTEMPPDMRGEADTYMKLAKAAYIESGLESIDGFGASSFRTGTGLRRHKVMIHHNPAKSDGLMWKALGTAPHELGGLKLMPATTAYAVHADLDVAGTFKWIKGFIASNLPAKQGAMLAELLEEANAEVPIEKIINSTGGEVGVYFTLNPNKIIELDARMLQMLNIGGGRPEPWDMEEPMPADDGEAEEGIDPGPTDAPPPPEKGFDFDRSPDDAPSPKGKGFQRVPPRPRNTPSKTPPIQSRPGKGTIISPENNPNVRLELSVDGSTLAPVPVLAEAAPPNFPVGRGGFGPGKPEMPKIRLPEPGLVLVLKVKDNTISELLAPLLEQAGTTAQQVDGVTMHSIPVPIPDLPLDVSPTFLQVGEYLVITSTLDLAKQVVAVHSGKSEGLADTAEFKKLTNGLDLKANMFTYSSSQISGVYRQFADYVFAVQRMEWERNAEEDILGLQGLMENITTKMNTFFTEMNAMFLKSQVTLLSVTDEGYFIQNQTTGHMPMDINVAWAIAAVPVAVGVASAAPAVMPALAQAKAKANRVKSINNLGQINRALQAYAQDNDGKLPPADKWCDAIMREVQVPILFVSPQDPEAKAKFEGGEKVSSYALNAAVAGKSLFELDPNIVLVFECNLGWNGTGGLADLRKNVPPDQWNISTVDGATMQADPNMLQRRRIQWKPER